MPQFISIAHSCPTLCDSMDCSTPGLPVHQHLLEFTQTCPLSPCCPRDSQESSPTPQFKTSVLWYSAFFRAQLSHPYMMTGKTIALTRWTFVRKAMFLLFNMLSRLVIAFLPRSNGLLILWLHSPLAVILEPKKLKSVTASAFSASIRVCVYVHHQITELYTWN